MEGPQNGVNGNLPQPPIGYNCVSAQLQRGGPQTVLNYEHIPQMCLRACTPTIQSSVTPLFIRPQFVSLLSYLAYNMQHFNLANMRSMSPSMQQGPFQYPYHQFVPAPQYTLYPQPYSSQFTYSQEVPPSSNKNRSNPQTRKLNPLVVVDPVSHTDVDLSKYQSTSDKTQNTNALQVSEPVNEKNSISEDNFEKDKNKQDNIEKENKDNISVKEENSDNNDIINLKVIKKENYEVKEREESCQEIGVKVDSNEMSFVDNLKIEETNTDIEKENKEADTIMDVQKASNANKDIKQDESNIDVKLEETTSHMKYDNEEEISTVSSEEEAPTVGAISTYHLPINTKESDEITLKKKLMYDREYLIKLKDSGRSRQCPLNMPPQSEFSEYIISTTPRTISCQLPESSYTQSNIDKSYKKQAPNRQFPSSNKKFNRPPKHINLDISENLSFIRSKSGYLPPQLREKQNAIDQYEELKRNIKSNLNKITPQNFQDCLAEIEKLNIFDNEEMSCLINEIFIKAVKEEAYSVTYAQFCNKLSNLYSSNTSFKSQLLKRCQDMFETPLKDQLCTVKSDWELKISNETDLKMKSLYESDLEEQVKKAKDKYFGNIRFIGELFLHNLLAAKVILNCISELLNGSDDSDAMLALCKLLETCGKQIDLKHKEQMNSYIYRILELSQSNDLEKRIRFKLRDIIDMRERDWTSRHIQREKKINPKTLQELKDEAAAEATALSIKLANMNKKRNVQSNHPRRTVPNLASKVSLKKLSFNSPFVDEKTVLGPTGGSWTTGSGSKSKASESDGWTSVGHQRQKNPGGRYPSNSRSREQSPQVILTNKCRNFESSAEASGADSRSSTPPSTLSMKKPYWIKPGEKLTVVSDEDRAEKIFSDLLSSGHFDVVSWMQLHQVKPVIEKWVDDMMEKDVNCRRHIGDSFNSLLIDAKISADQIVQGTQAFVSSIDDLICDIPKIWEFFAQFLERFIYNKNSNISFFVNIFKSILPNMDVAKCLSMTFHEASSRLGHEIVGQVFQNSINWNVIVSRDLESFIKENELEFTVKGRAPLHPVGGEPLSYIAQRLDEMLSSNMTNGKIFCFLEKHMDKATWKKSEFMRTITTSILKAIQIMPEDVVRNYLKEKKEIIKRVSNHKVENEKEILISILQISDKLKNDTLIFIYDILITENIVSKSALDCYLEDKTLQSESNFKSTSNIINQFDIKKDKRR